MDKRAIDDGFQNDGDVDAAPLKPLITGAADGASAVNSVPVDRIDLASSSTHESNQNRTILHAANIDHSNANVPKLSFAYKWDENQTAESPRINCHSQMTLINTILDGLKENDKRQLCESWFGPIIKLSSRVRISHQLIHFMLLRQVVTDEDESMWFAVNNRLLRFGIKEFWQITGLLCTSYPPTETEQVDAKTVIGYDRCTLQKLEEIYMKEPEDSEFKYKMALLLLVDGVIVGQAKKTMCRQITINMLNDLDAFKQYPWGRLAFEVTLQSFKKAKLTRDKDKATYAYHLYGLPMAFQIWIFESIPKIADMFATKVWPNKLPFCVRWRSLSKLKFINFERMKMNAHSDLSIKSIIVDKEFLDVDLGDDEIKDDRIRQYLELDMNLDPIVVRYVEPVVAKVSKRKIVDKDDDATSDADDFQDPTMARSGSAYHHKYKKESVRVINEGKGSTVPSDLSDDKLKSVLCESKKDEQVNIHDIDHATTTPVLDPNSYCGYDKSMDANMPSWASTIMGQLDGLVKSQEESSRKIDLLKEEVSCQGQEIEDIMHSQRDMSVFSTRFEGHLFAISNKTDRLIRLTEDISQAKALTKESRDSTFQTPHTYSQAVRESNSLNDDFIDEIRKDIDEAIEVQSSDDELDNEQVVEIIKDPSEAPINRRSLRQRRQSKYRKSPWGEKVAFPRAPKHNLLTMKQRTSFYDWYLNVDAKDDIVGYCDTFGRDKFKSLLDKNCCLWRKHLRELIMHIRKAIVDFPHQYHRIAVLDDLWTNKFDSKLYSDMTTVGPETFVYSDGLIDYIRGHQPIHFKRNLYEVDVIFAPMSINSNHWVALEINLKLWTIYVYDSNHSFIEANIVEKVVEPIAVMFPLMLRQHGCHSGLGEQLNTPFSIYRVPNTPQNTTIGVRCSCGVFTIKFIEYLSSGRTDLSLICDEYMSAYREQLAYILFEREWNAPFVEAD